MDSSFFQEIRFLVSDLFLTFERLFCYESQIGKIISTNPRLYHRHWIKSFKSQFIVLMGENKGLDPITGYPIDPSKTFQLRRHHMSYDKSLLDTQFLLLMTYTSHALIRHPPKQLYYNQPIRHTAGSLQDQVWCEEIKQALLNDQPPPHWTDPTHPWHQYVNPRAVQLFNRRKILLQTYGFQVFSWGFIGPP